MYWFILIVFVYVFENIVYNYNMNGGWILYLRCSVWFWGYIILEFDF